MRIYYLEWCHRNEQLAPAGSFSGLVHCLAITDTDLWCCTGSGIIAVFDLATLQLKNKVSENPGFSNTDCSGALYAVMYAHILLTSPACFT